MRILVVENHPDFRRGLQMFFEVLGCHAVFTEDVAAARHAAASGAFDVLLSDISLPDGSGWDLLAQLQAAGTQPPTAVAMSGFGSASDLAKSKATGFTAHLIKPFSPEELKIILRDARPREI